MAALVTRFLSFLWLVLNVFSSSEEMFIIHIITEGCLWPPLGHPLWAGEEGTLVSTSKFSKTRQHAVKRFAVLDWKSHLAAVSKVSLSNFPVETEMWLSKQFLGIQGCCARVGFLKPDASLPRNVLQSGISRPWGLEGLCQVLLSKTHHVNM